MSKLTKVFLVMLRKIIFLLDGINNRIFTDIYYQYLKLLGVKFNGKPNYIASNAYIDGQGYKLITIGKDVVISREAMILTHDFSIETALHAIGLGTNNRTTHLNLPISIGDNSFIGARASLLPGTNIGKNCIIGACAVVKGTIPDNSVVIGNPCRILTSTIKMGEKFRQE